MSFRGTVYRYPVALWIPHAYPSEPPIVYVTPAKDMVVRPGQHVAGDGRVYHPYLAQWGRYWDVSEVLKLLLLLDTYAHTDCTANGTSSVVVAAMALSRTCAASICLGAHG